MQLKDFDEEVDNWDNYYLLITLKSYIDRSYEKVDVLEDRMTHLEINDHTELINKVVDLFDILR